MCIPLSMKYANTSNGHYCRQLRRISTGAPAIFT
jgi:hypothetical protein